MCVCVPHVCRYPQKSEIVSDPPQLELQVTISHLMWVLGTELGSSKKKQVLLTIKPSY